MAVGNPEGVEVRGVDSKSPQVNVCKNRDTLPRPRSGCNLEDGPVSQKPYAGEVARSYGNHLMDHQCVPELG